MTVGVVIITAERDEHLTRVLRALAAQHRPADRVVVVDMADARPTIARAPLSVARVVVEPVDGVLPLGAARNAGAAHLDCDVLAFLDVDCIPGPAFVADHAGALAAHGDALACGRVRYLRAGWHTAGPGHDLDELSAPHPARPAPARDELDTDRHELFWSLNFAVRSATWDRLGGFDTGYRGYGAEDTDLGLRARRLGIPLLWVAGAGVYHQWHPPTRLDPARRDEIVANARRFRERWGTWPMTGWLDELAAAGVVRWDPAADLLELVAP
ncbi:MAG TPA: glycosyltransferase [Ilumatobacteraceae bacterium]|nr:glycosyltransferase [Ilumatobacteraceae bacterium]